MPPPQVGYAPPVTEHVPLHCKSSCKTIARASGGANNMRPLSWVAQTEKIRFSLLPLLSTHVYNSSLKSRKMLTFLNKFIGWQDSLCFMKFIKIDFLIDLVTNWILHYYLCVLPVRLGKSSVPDCASSPLLLTAAPLTGSQSGQRRLSRAWLILLCLKWEIWKPLRTKLKEWLVNSIQFFWLHSGIGSFLFVLTNQNWGKVNTVSWLADCSTKSLGFKKSMSVNLNLLRNRVKPKEKNMHFGGLV